MLPDTTAINDGYNRKRYYIWHQTVIVVLGYFVLKLTLPVGWLYVLLLAVTVLLSELVQHSAVSRFLFGIHRKVRPQTQPRRQSPTRAPIP